MKLLLKKKGMKKINCILLVDDDEATNFLHMDIIEESGIAENVFTALNGQEGLDYLQKEGKFAGGNEQYPRPNLIFLDINMPLMDGFEFLRRYKQLNPSLRADILIVFLTTSNSQRDKTQAKEMELAHGFYTKPLTLEMLNELHQELQTPGILILPK